MLITDPVYKDSPSSGSVEDVLDDVNVQLSMVPALKYISLYVAIFVELTLGSKWLSFIAKVEPTCI